MRHWPQRVETMSQGPMIGEMLEQGAFQQHRFNSGIFNNSFSGASAGASIPTSTPSNTRNNEIIIFDVRISFRFLFG